MGECERDASRVSIGDAHLRGVRDDGVFDVRGEGAAGDVGIFGWIWGEDVDSGVEAARGLGDRRYLWRIPPHEG